VKEAPDETTGRGSHRQAHSTVRVSVRPSIGMDVAFQGINININMALRTGLRAKTLSRVGLEECKGSERPEQAQMSWSVRPSRYRGIAVSRSCGGPNTTGGRPAGQHTGRPRPAKAGPSTLSARIVVLQQRLDRMVVSSQKERHSSATVDQRWQDMAGLERGSLQRSGWGVGTGRLRAPLLAQRSH